MISEAIKSGVYVRDVVLDFLRPQFLSCDVKLQSACKLSKKSNKTI